MDEGGGSEGSAVVYVGHNLPESITKDHVLQHFKAFVPHINILRSTIITNKAGKRHGKLFFTNDAAAGQAVSQMNGTQIRGFKLNVNRWGPKKKESEGDIDPLSQFLHQRAEATPHYAVVEDDSSDDSQSDISSISIGSSIMSDSDSSFKAYFGTNLPGRIQDSALKTQLQGLGYIVKSVHVITAKNNQSRFAIVAFSSQEALDQAVKQLNGTKMLGYKLSVSCWVDKKVRRKGKGSSHKQRQGQTPEKQEAKPSASGTRKQRQTPEKQEVKLSASGTGPSDLCTVILKGVPPSVDNSLLRTICEGYGKVTSLHMNIGEGTAYVSYPSAELAAAAGSQLNGLTCGGGRLTVVSSASKEPPYSGHTTPAQHLDSGYGTPHQPPYQSSLQGSGPPLQGHVPPLQGHAPPLQGYGPPLQGHGPPLQGHGPPLQGHGPPLQGHGPPLQGHGPPLQGHGPPLQGHGPPLQGHGPPLQGHGPPLQGPAPLLQGPEHPLQGPGHPLQGPGHPLQGHGPPLQGHRPPLQGHGPPLQGHGPPLQGHGPPLQGPRHPLQGHGPPLQGHGPPLQGHGPPLQGPGHPLQGHGHSLQSPGPPLQGHGPPLQGSVPSPQGQAPLSLGYGHGPPPQYDASPQSFGPPPQGYITPPQSYSQGAMQPDHGHFPQPSQSGGAYSHPAQYHMQPSSHESQGPAQHLGQQLPPTGSLPGPSMQEHYHSGVVSVKVSNLHVSVTEKELKGILSFVPSAVVAFHRTPGNKPNNAHIKCTDQADADRVVESFKGRKFHGMPVSVKIQKGKEESVPPPTANATLPADMETAVSVKVFNLPNSVTEKQIRRHIRSIKGISSVVLKTILKQEHNYAYVHCENGVAAQQVVQRLDGMKLLGTMIKATVQQPKKAKKKEEAATSEVDTAEEGQEMSKDLYDFFQQRFSKDIASFEARGGTLLCSEGFLTVRGPETEVSEFYRNAMEPVKDGSQSLTADQWGQLMAAKKGGTTLFQELSSPFLHNPNVKIDRRENPFMLVLVGFQEAVDAARSHFLSKMDSKIAVDRVKLFALAHLNPDLPDILEAECAVNVSGFHAGSSELALDSDGGDLTRARLRLLGELEAVFMHKKKVSLKCNLVASAQRFIESRKAQVVLCIREHGGLILASEKQSSNSADEQLQVTLCGKPRETVTYVYHSLCAKPSCETVTMSASQFASLNDSTENSMEKLQQEYGVILSYNSDECNVAIEGFNSGDVKAVFRILYNSKQTVCKTWALHCSKDEALYLNHVLLNNPTEEGEELLATLQDECSTTVRGGNKKIVLVGPASSLESAAKRIKESSLLKGLQSKIFHYFGRIPALLTDLKSTVHRLEESHEVVAILSVRSEEDKRPSNVDVTLLSNNVESFEAVCEALQGIKPSSKKRDLEASEVRQLKGEFLRQLESAHSVHIHLIRSKNLLIVQSLWPSAVSLAFTAINDLLRDTVKVYRKVPVSVAQVRFLREKRTSELDNDALQVSMEYPESRAHQEANDLVYIIISGLRHFVESAAESINGMLNGFGYKEEELHVTSMYQWTREWKQATKQCIEDECDVIVEFPTHTSPSKPEGKGGGTQSETYTIEICFMYVHESALQQARDIVTQCVTLSLHSVEVDRAQQVEMLKALKDRKLTCAGTLTSVQLNKAEGVVNIISPLRFPNGVEEMEERLLKYVRKEVSSSTEVDLEPPLSVLIQNRHFKELKKDKTVFFKFTPNRVSLSGKTADVEAAKERLKRLVTQLEASMCTQLVPVPKWLQFAIATKEVRSVLNRFEKAHNVLIVVPKDITCIRNELKWEAKVHPEGWSQTCIIQLLHGSLTKEDTDAIVIAANENLELMGGLAGSILKAGGPTIQEECMKYTDVKGPVNVGNAVCLGSGNLPCKKVIHAVGPSWQGGKSGEGHTLQATYIRSLEVAVQNGCQSIAFPAISTGVFHFPVQRCAWSAVNALTYFFSVCPNRFSTVKFVLLQEADVSSFQEAFQSLLSDRSFNMTLMHRSSPSVKPSSGSVSPLWMWLDDSGSYQSFASSISTQLEQQFAGNPSGTFQLQRGTWSYTMNLGAMTQTNKETGKVRTLRRDAGSLSSQWYWKDDNGLMQPYTASESIAIENIRLRHGAGNSVSINGQNYMFDFEMQVQVNSTTGHRRRIEYRAGQQPATAASSSSPLKASGADSSVVKISVKGCRKDVDTVIVPIETHIKGMCGSDVLQFSKKFSQRMERCLQDVCARFHVDVDFKDVAPQTRAANLIGWKVSVSKVVEEGRKTLIELMQAGSTEEVCRPPEWSDDDTSLALKEVKPASVEFSKVLSLMQRTLPNVRIAKLERIQNDWLWTRYSQHRELIKKKNNGTARELDLFHGTRSNPPDRIYTGEEGFDMRFSAQGMWGTGNYFAVNASYSHAYAYSTGGVRQMFLVKVVVGASYDCQSNSNSSLRMPPEKPSKTSSLFGVERYDSVLGTTNGSQVYIIYDNLKAYPFYLITYT